MKNTYGKPSVSKLRTQITLRYVHNNLTFTITLRYQEPYVIKNLTLSRTLRYQEPYVINNLTLSRTLRYQEPYVINNLTITIATSAQINKLHVNTARAHFYDHGVHNGGSARVPGISSSAETVVI